MSSTECIILVQKICNTATIANYQISGKNCYCQWGTDMRPNPGAGYVNCLLKSLKKSGKSGFLKMWLDRYVKIIIDAMLGVFYIFLLVDMVPHGQGICEASTHEDWTNPRFPDKEACKELCKRDESCSYVSYRKEEFCKRYSTLTCILTAETQNLPTDYTYKKIATGNNKSYSTLIKKSFYSINQFVNSFAYLNLFYRTMLFDFEDLSNWSSINYTMEHTWQVQLLQTWGK